MGEVRPVAPTESETAKDLQNAWWAVDRRSDSVPGYDLELIAAAPCQSIRYSSLLALDREARLLPINFD